MSHFPVFFCLNSPHPLKSSEVIFQDLCCDPMMNFLAKSAQPENLLNIISALFFAVYFIVSGVISLYKLHGTKILAIDIIYG